MKKYIILGLAALLCLGATIVPDQYDVLFCKANGTGASFVDSSTANTKTITANGNATQLPIKFNKSAGFFNGTTDYVVVPDSADWDFGTGAFTIEFFVNFASVTSPSNPIMFAVSAYNDGIYMAWDNTNLDVYIDSAHFTFAHGGRSVNTWYHVMLIRSGTDLKAYINGTQVGTTQTCSTDITGMSGGFGIGQTPSPTAGQYLNGWMKEFRVSNVARTPSVPTTQYVADANTKLLLHFDTPATSPIAPAIYFDGTGDYLSVASHADFAIGTGDFTYEYWWKQDTSSSEQWQWGIGTTATSMDFQTAGGGRWDISIAGSTQSTTHSTTVNKWMHIALVRTSGAVKLFIDGRQINSDLSASGSIAQGIMYIGGGFSSANLIGSVREIRFSNVARYTTAFTPSQTGFTVDANTKLYIKGNENNGVTTFVDSETSAKTVTTNGDTKIKYTEDYRSSIFVDSETTPKYPYPVGNAKVDFFAIGSGAGVGFFDGTNSLIYSADSADWDMNADFTGEAYVRWRDFTGNQSIIERYTDADGSAIWLHTDGTNLEVKLQGSTTYSAFTPALNTWYHIAMTKNGTSVKRWVNGTEYGTAGSDSTAISQSTPISIGGGKYSTGYEHYFKGLIDNARVSKGIARYTATFNPEDDYARTGSSGRRKTNWFWFF